MVNPLTGNESFRVWMDTVNQIINLRTVDGNFKIVRLNKDNRTVTIGSGRARANGESILFAQKDLSFEAGTIRTIGCMFGSDEISSVSDEEIPEIGFIPLYKVETNNSSITSFEDLRTWAFDIDASDIPTREQVKQLRDEINEVMEAYDNLPKVFSGDYNDLDNKPELFSGDYRDLENTPTLFDGDYNSLDNKPNLFSGNYQDLENVPTFFDGNYESLENKPNLFSGNYQDLENTPVLFDGDYESLNNKPVLFSGNYQDLENTPTLFDGDYNSLENTPILGSMASQNSEDYATADQGAKADSAVQGEGISRIVLISKTDYDNLQEKDPTTFYIIKQ